MLDHYYCLEMALVTDKNMEQVIAVVGPTAVGKTDLVLGICEELHAEIVNLDSMQVYRYMDIGTAKPTPSERERVRHHLIDIVDPDDDYDLYRYINDAARVSKEISARNKLPLLTGGTGLYLRGFEEGVFDIGDEASPAGNIQEETGIRERLEAELVERGRGHLFERLQKCDQVTAARIHPNDTYRLLRALLIFEQTGMAWSEHLERQRKSGRAGQGGFQPRKFLKIGLIRERELLYERINLRTEKMFAEGLVDEVRALLDRGYGADLKPMQAIGYRHAVKYLAGEFDRREAVELMGRDTRRYAKRQLTWFRKDPQINWIEPDRTGDIFDMIKKFLDE